MTTAPRSFGPHEQASDKLAAIAELTATEAAGWRWWLGADTSTGRRDPLPGEQAALLAKLGSRT